MRTSRRYRMLIAASAVLAACGSSEQVPDEISFNRHVRPILSNSCFPCHGPDANARQADLRLDDREVALGDREGVRAIVPGDPARSELVRRIRHPDPEERMPPLESERSLSPRDAAVLERWIAEGAPYEPHWAYVASERSPLPEVRASEWVRNPIDRFILARLETEGLTPSAEADPVTLARRLHLDLTGLPPGVEAVDAFAARPTETAYEELVDRLLDSPHYGERMAVDWLDQVRYADTNGYHSDEPRSVYPYRDYVIRAFNQNMPFDRFTREQLAGDLLPDPTTDELVASAFNRLNQITAEGGAQPEEYRAKYDADRVRAVGSVWLGATIGCAQCHDHKFDPFTSRDFYSMGAFFADVEELDVFFSESDWAPFMFLPTEEERAAVARIDARIAALERDLGTSTPELEAAQRSWEVEVRPALAELELGWLQVTPEDARSTGGVTLELQDDLSLLATGPEPDDSIYTVRFETELEAITGLRLEVMSDPSFRRGLTHSNKAFILTEVEVQVGPRGGPLRPVRLGGAIAHEGRVGQSADGDPRTSWRVEAIEKHSPTVRAVYTFAEPIPGGAGADVLVRLENLGTKVVKPKTAMGRFRLSVTAAPEPDLEAPAGIPEVVLRALARASERSSGEAESVGRYYRTVAPSLDATRREWLTAQKERDRIHDAMERCLITRRREPRVSRFLPRGNWMDPGEVVEPAVPGFLPPLDVNGRRATRLDLADWLVSPENPLTARVIANRLWRLFFGTGLSRVLDDLGAQGEWPVHPELLDWLAVEFVESGWDVKYMVRLMVTSAAYRQSSQSTAVLQERDPANRLIARQSRFRLPAEMVRDNALSVSGLLSRRIGGRSVKPYQPEGYWEHLNFPKRTYEADTGESQYRRGLYTHWQRSFLHPSLVAFDAPSREECVAQRVESNTPLQALTLLNDPTYVEAARVFAQRIASEGGATLDEQVAWAFREAVARSPTAEEARRLRGLYEKHLRDYASDPEAAAALLKTGLAPSPEDIEPALLAAWTSVARALLNLHETVTRS